VFSPEPLLSLFVFSQLSAIPRQSSSTDDDADGKTLIVETAIKK